MRGRTPLLLAAPLALAGCNLLVVGTFVAPDDASRAPAANPAFFAVGQLAPAGGVAPAEVPAAPAEAPPEVPATLPTVRLLGRVMVAADAVGIANVSGGYVTGTPITVIDARTGRTHAAGVTFFDGSFALDVPVGPSGLAALVSTELFATADHADRTVLSTPVNLHAGVAEQRIIVTPGTTALTLFLRRLAADMETAKTGLPADPPDLAALVGPRFGALVAGIEDEEREGFVRLAESSEELRSATSLAAIRAAIDEFASRFVGARAR